MSGHAVDDYLAERTGTYERRAVRYRAALGEMQLRGLSDDDTVFDIGAGYTELDVALRTDGKWRGRYIPIDIGIDPAHDLEQWEPPRSARFAVALEVLEHLADPWRLVSALQEAVETIIVSVPNPRTVDVLGIDPTHRTILTAAELTTRGFTVSERTFYGGVYSAGAPDALFGVWPPAS
ncbi:hypothetical protein [Microbacterium sp. 77mftsu3.1]|uniref:hypothetical protein n=1 Tax=Microbacterium sp. 77mftsu3.1 TaxID=1761802 RepID=UPI000376D775|nr:hypothetical protein [Microbacterium sp. 77mftsu3.1]SDH49532.1 hypothetical protein SAMN04488590_3441 [Microbacterium sp. 77mftsu3.1]